MEIMSEQVNELFSALSKAQGQISHASKDKLNPHFKSRYADLASVWDACREPLSSNGLSVIQIIQPAENGVLLVTTMGHASGQWIRGIMPVAIDKPGPQAFGSALTYARRYALSSIVGVAPDDDDDGERAQNTYKNSTPTKKQPDHFPEPIDPSVNLTTKDRQVTKEEVATLLDMMKKVDAKSIDAMNKYISEKIEITDYSQLPESIYTRCIQGLKFNIGKKLMEEQQKKKEASNDVATQPGDQP